MVLGCRTVFGPTGRQNQAQEPACGGQLLCCSDSEAQADALGSRP